MRQRPETATVAFVHQLPRAGVVRVSLDNEGTVRVRPLGTPERAVGDARFATPGWALGGLNLGMVHWDPFVCENVTLTQTERESLEARIESALKHAIDPAWFKHPSLGW
jgi:hypothetical protein